MSLSAASRRQAGLILVVLPTVIYGGVSLLALLINPSGDYARNPLRQNLWRAGHAHAGVLLVLRRQKGGEQVMKITGIWASIVRNRSWTSRPD